MSTRTTNVVVHFDQTIGTEQLQRMEAAIRGQSGVLGTRRNPRTPQLLVVDYDADATSAQHILGGIEHQGIRAQLVGM
jgi:hypothetical protein